MEEHKEQDALIDISNIAIDDTMTKEERIKDFIEKVNNPYYFKVGDIIVKSTFSSSGGTLQEKMEQYFETAFA